jgi:hypothetical protein
MLCKAAEKKSGRIVLGIIFVLVVGVIVYRRYAG